VVSRHKDAPFITSRSACAALPASPRAPSTNGLGLLVNDATAGRTGAGNAAGTGRSAGPAVTVTLICTSSTGSGCISAAGAASPSSAGSAAAAAARAAALAASTAATAAGSRTLVTVNVAISTGLTMRGDN